METKILGLKADLIIYDEIATQLPVFVYGTLRKGFHNYDRILKGKTLREQTAKLPNADIYHAHSFQSFPAVKHGSGTVIGELMMIDGTAYDEVLRSLDWLEGYRPDSPSSMYIREIVTVLVGDEEVTAYTYIWNRPEVGRKIHSGDWAATQQGPEFVGLTAEEEEDAEFGDDDDEDYCHGCDNEPYCCTCDKGDDD